jgi:hypothetical protein
MKKVWSLILLLGLLVTAGCAANGKQTQSAAPENVYSADGIIVWAHADRHYVTGSEKRHKMFAEHQHLPYTKTILGAGPNGETVVFEVAKKDSSFVENLIKKYKQIPFLVTSKGDNFSVYKFNGRIYVISNPKTRDFFVKHHHLPYTKTLLGIGPGGETVIFEVNKKDPTFVDQLIKMYKS